MLSPKVDKHYDLIIIGSGPAGLAALSSVQEDYSLNMLDSTQVQRASSWIKKGNREKKRVMVIDPNENWLDDWEKNFDILDIQFLRSPAIAHCSYFDSNALLVSF
jgi:ribulose 1,5-bisphosphate synthetase/thiazole synthase